MFFLLWIVGNIELLRSLLKKIKLVKTCGTIAKQSLQEFKKHLNLQKRNCTISKSVGVGTAGVGTILAIVGFALSPITFGASLGLTIAGGSLGILGSLTSTGTRIYDDKIIQKNHHERLANIFQNYYKALSDCLNDFVKIQHLMDW